MLQEENETKGQSGETRQSWLIDCSETCPKKRSISCYMPLIQSILLALRLKDVSSTTDNQSMEGAQTCRKCTWGRGPRSSR